MWKINYASSEHVFVILEWRTHLYVVEILPSNFLHLCPFKWLLVLIKWHRLTENIPHKLGKPARMLRKWIGCRETSAEHNEDGRQQRQLMQLMIKQMKLGDTSLGKDRTSTVLQIAFFSYRIRLGDTWLGNYIILWLARMHMLFCFHHEVDWVQRGQDNRFKPTQTRIHLNSRHCRDSRAGIEFFKKHRIL